jgi:hypothetical protein
MTSQRKIFKRVGLRRDKNFADLSDSVTGLNNLLDTLVDAPDATFISQDLNAIRNIFSSGMSSNEYRKFIGSSVQETTTSGSTRAVFPRITYQNRLDKFEVSSGEPRLHGGNGLTAKYFNADQVEDTEEIFTGITTGGSIPDDNFWEAGQFEYTGKIHPQSVNAAGGVQWEGYFVPINTGVHQFSVNSSLSYTFDFETEGYSGSGIGTYVEYARVGLTTTITGTTTAPNLITIPLANVKHVGLGMSVTGSGIRAGTFIDSFSGVDINASTGVITLSNSAGDPIQTANSNISVTFSRSAGTTAKTRIVTYVLEKYRPYRIRSRFFVPPGVNQFSIEKTIKFNLIRPAGQLGRLRYQNLYGLDYDFTDSAKGSFNRFLDQSLLSGGNKTDGTEIIGGTANSDAYVRVSTNKKVDIKYQPKTSLADITRRTFTASWSAGAKVINIDDTTDIEVGNYLFGTGLTSDINTPVRVTDIQINTFIIIDTAANASGTNQSISVINHRGFVKRVTATGNSGTVTIDAGGGNTVGIRSKQIAIWNGVTARTGITTTGGAGSFTVTPSQTFNSQPVYVYESRGLIDRGLNAFCVPASTQCIFVTAAASVNDTVLTVSPESLGGNVAVGWKIQGFPFSGGEANIDAINTSNNTITISSGIQKAINPNSNYTATNSGESRELCCPPTDTSPPFTPTEEGLETTNQQPNLQITGGNVKFDEFNANVNTAKITEYTNSDQSNNRLEIRAGDGNNYKILCV